jgi:membrane fusion protein (multidrug efflux system)
MRNVVNDSASQQAATAPLLSKVPIVTGRRFKMRSRGLWRLTTFVVATLSAIAASYDVSWAIGPRYQESTDDAYVSGNIVQVTSEIAGTVVAIGCDNQFVRVGQVVVELDDSDARIAVERAKANLDNTIRQVCGMLARTAGPQACMDRANVRNHPDVLAAADHVHASYLQLARTKLPASVSGFVAKRTVELGQRVSPGQALMAIVPLNELWVEANFKEQQLAAIRVGQPAMLKSHRYGGNVTYHGTVAGLGAGTTSLFGLSPLQNANGDRISVGRRVPVCIAVNSRELVEHPLQIGLSMTVDVDTREREDGRPLDLAKKTPSHSHMAYAMLCHPNFGTDVDWRYRAAP